MPHYVAGRTDPIDFQDLSNWNIFATHDGKMNIIPSPACHLTSHWKQHSRTLEARSRKENIPVVVPIALHVPERVECTSQSVELDRAIVVAIVRPRLPVIWGCSWWRRACSRTKDGPICLRLML